LAASVGGSLTEVLTRPVTGRHLVAGGLLLGLAAATPVLTGLALGADTPDTPLTRAVSQARSVPSPLTARPVPAPVVVARTGLVRASRGGARTALPGTLVQTRFELRTVTVGRSFTGLASWYGGGFQGRRTASGERFDTHALTAASRTLPFGTRLRVCRSGRCVVVRVNDRGPYAAGRVLDLSAAARSALGFSGVARVTATPIGVRRVVTPHRAVAPAPARRPLTEPAMASSAVAPSPGVDGLGVALAGASGLGLAWGRHRHS